MLVVTSESTTMAGILRCVALLAFFVASISAFHLQSQPSVIQRVCSENNMEMRCRMQGMRCRARQRFDADIPHAVCEGGSSGFSGSRFGSSSSGFGGLSSGSSRFGSSDFGSFSGGRGGFDSFGGSSDFSSLSGSSRFPSSSFSSGGSTFSSGGRGFSSSGRSFSSGGRGFSSGGGGWQSDFGGNSWSG